MTRLLLRSLPEPVVKWLRAYRLRQLYGFGELRYSQEGEDGILARIFETQRFGFYVDVGAHHPIRYSNTYRLYVAGWRGINVEPNPEMVSLFRRARPRDITVQAAISDQECERTYFLFDDGALNTFDAALAAQRSRESPFKIIGERRVQMRRLDRILDEYLPSGTTIDVMSIDTEGLDAAVVRSLDWRRYRPRVVLIELPAPTLADVLENECTLQMMRNGYVAFAKTLNTVFFRDDGARGLGAMSTG